jgi:hypothetical protein
MLRPLEVDGNSPLKLSEAQRKAEKRPLPSLTHGRRAVARLDQLVVR